MAEKPNRFNAADEQHDAEASNGSRAAQPLLTLVGARLSCQRAAGGHQQQGDVNDDDHDTQQAANRAELDHLRGQ